MREKVDWGYHSKVNICIVLKGYDGNSHIHNAERLENKFAVESDYMNWWKVYVCLNSDVPSARNEYIGNNSGVKFPIFTVFLTTTNLVSYLMLVKVDEGYMKMQWGDDF